MGYTITSIDHSSSHILVSKVSNTITFLIGFANLCVKGQRGLHTDEEAFNIEGLKHDFSDLLSVFRSVHRRLCQDESVVFRLTFQVVVD